MKTNRTTVVIGPPGIGRCAELFRRFMESNDPVSPRNLYLSAGPIRKRQLQIRFLERFPAAFEIPVVTFPELVRSLLKLTSSTRRSIEAAEKLALVEEILQKGRFELLGGSSAGLLSQLSDYISFIKQHNIHDEDLLRLRYGKFGHEPSLLEEDLIQVFAAYQRLLEENGAEDFDGEQGRAYTALLTGEISVKTAWPELRRLVVEGSHRMTPLESGLVRLLIRDVDEACLSLPGVDEADPQKLPPSWGFLKDGPLEWTTVESPAAGRIVLCRPQTREDEVLAVARRILQMRSRDPGFAFDSAAVVCARLDAYEAHIEGLFPKLGIPHRAAGRHARHGAAVAALAKYVRLALEDFDCGRLFDFLLDAHIRVPGLSVDGLHRVEETAVEAGFRGGVECWTIELPAFARLLADNAAPAGRESAQQLVHACDALAQALPRFRLEADKIQTPLQWRREVFEKLRPLWRTPNHSGLSRRRRENLTLRGLAAELEKACAASGATQLGLAGFAAILERQLEHAVSRSDFEGDAVAVSTPSRIQQAEFDVVFWLGLADGEFPDPRPRHLFIDEEGRSPWGHSDRETRLAEDRSLFETLIGCAKKEAVLSCPVRLGDSPALPSPFWSELLKPAEGDQRRNRIADEGAAPKVRFPLQPAARENVRRGRMVVGLRESEGLSRFQGVISDPEALRTFRGDLFPESIDLSPSAIESIVRCGFRYFALRVLGIARPPQRWDGVSPLVRGALIHRVLHRFMSRLEKPEDFTEAARIAWRKGQLQRMSRLLRRELERLKRERKWRDELFWEHEEQQLARGLDGDGRAGVLAEFVDQQWERLQSCDTVGLELRLGPLDLGIVGDLNDAKLVPVRLKGKLDRLDRGPHGLFVIDYKTGQDQRPRAYQGWGFQLPLYAWLAEKVFEEPVDQAAFYSVQPPLEVGVKPLSARVDGEASDSGMKRFVEYYRHKALRVARSLYDGQFPVTLLGRSRAGCRVCEFRSACRFDRSEMEKLRELNRFPADEPIVVKGRWAEPAESEPIREKVPV